MTDAVLQIPESSGIVEFVNFFPNLQSRQVLVDAELLQFVEENAHNYNINKPFHCEIGYAPTGGVLSEVLGFTTKTTLNLDQICGIITYLGSDGWPILAITSHEDEVNVLIGYVEVTGKYWALIVEHEYNRYGNKLVEEINLNMREIDHDEDDPVVILRIL